MLPGHVSSRNLIKPFFIAGFVLGEIYAIYVLMAPPPAPGHPGVHWSGAITVIALFGPFGALVGGGIGLLLTGLLSKFKR